MTGTERSLLAAVLAAPEADFPRRQYADWLEENGGGDRAEFIRYQCDHPGVKEGCWGDASVGQECHPHQPCPTCDLVHARGLLPWALLGEDGYTLRRGFVSAVKCSAAAWLAHCDEILAATPLEELELTTELDWYVAHAGVVTLTALRNTNFHEYRCKRAKDGCWWGHDRRTETVLSVVVKEEWPGLKVILREPDGRGYSGRYTSDDILNQFHQERPTARQDVLAVLRNRPTDVGLPGGREWVQINSPFDRPRGSTVLAVCECQQRLLTSAIRETDKVPRIKTVELKGVRVTLYGLRWFLHAGACTGCMRVLHTPPTIDFQTGRPSQVNSPNPQN